VEILEGVAKLVISGAVVDTMVAAEEDGGVGRLVVLVASIVGVAPQVVDGLAGVEVVGLEVTGVVGCAGKGVGDVAVVVGVVSTVRMGTADFGDIKMNKCLVCFLAERSPAVTL
jgi:hypothetical protein